MNFYKRYPGDYMRDTSHLSLMEHGAYTVLLDTLYASESGLPASIDALYRICRAMTKLEREAVKNVAEQFFPVNADGTRHNKRADAELARWSDQADTNRRIAVEREAKRKAHEQSTNRATNSEPKPETRNQKELQKPLSEPAKAPIPDCPQAELLTLYRQILPELTQPRVWDGARAKAMRSRWLQCARATPEWGGYETQADGLEFWQRFFNGVASCRKLTAGIPYPDGAIWKPDLPWLMKAENFAKVIEGKYA